MDIIRNDIIIIFELLLTFNQYVVNYNIIKEIVF